MSESITPSDHCPGSQDFSGSYDAEDVTFLLEPIEVEPTPIAEKERLIQSGMKHYSEMISREAEPTPEYMALFNSAVDRNLDRFASDLCVLANLIAQSSQANDIPLASLARAGTPIGVLVGRALRSLGFDCTHYSISIIRDRGIDAHALNWILSRHDASNVRFLDGWAGKGVIGRELQSAIASYNAENDTGLSDELFAVADLCGIATAATDEDYLIPSAILGATVAGLVSRSILNDEVIANRSFHGCLFLNELAAFDISTSFADRVWDAMKPKLASFSAPALRLPSTRTATISQSWLKSFMTDYSISNFNHVKPGICEATRVLLRRVPDMLIVRNERDQEVQHLLHLAEQKCVPINIDPNLPIRAVALIKDVLRR